VEVTFSVSNSQVAHQLTLERADSSTIRVIIDGISYVMADARARPDSKAITGGGISLQVFQTTVVVMQSGHQTFSGVISKYDSDKIIGFIAACGLPAI
jgi:hypothetical protein